jgi:asparagine synthase (glutamine-hydrolysing)
MCGIAGWYRRAGKPVQSPVIEGQCAALRHRGPDDRGLLLDGDFGFGMQRLSIIDPKGGHQPIDSADGRFAIIFNGEIYNHRELRLELGPGVRFRTQSDTETIVAGYARWGSELWPRLNGMFAVAIWDRRERRLTLARDRAGIKPLYLTEQQGGLAFGSEIAALLCLPDHVFDEDMISTDQFFSFGHALPGRSIYRQIRTLSPGTFMTIGPDGGAAVERYWTPTYGKAVPQSESAWVEQLRAKWLKTVREHMLADVEIGAFLSGGIDSSAVVAAMSQLSDRPVRTFSIGFPDPRLNEAPYAEAVARHLGCNHTTWMVDLKRSVDLLPEVQRCYGEPFADPAAIPTYYMSELAARELKVVLSGDGGDEIFFGYRRHLTEQRLGRRPWLAEAANRLTRGIPPTPSRRLNKQIQRWQKALDVHALPDGAQRYFAKRQVISASVLSRMYDPAFIEAIGGIRTPGDLRRTYFADETMQPLSGIQQFALAEFMIGLPSMMLKKVDRASMAHSLEVRTPMLGHDLVEWAFNLPTDMKIRGNVGKYVLRRAVEPWLPRHIASRRKQGFVLPLSAWLAGDFGSFTQEVWNESGAARDGIFSHIALEKLFDEHRNGLRDHSRFLYSLAVYGLWRLSEKERRPTLRSA